MIMLFSIVVLALMLLMVYFFYPGLCRRGVTEAETSALLPGDDIVRSSTSGYTLATSIAAFPSEVWPWLVQMGQGRAGFYTYEWIENLIGANIHNANTIVPELQHIAPGDSVWLTPDPYLDRPGQYLVVAHLYPPKALVYRQVLPNRSVGSWAYVLHPGPDNSTRLVFRRRSSKPSLFDRIMKPGYYFMDMGMLAGIKKRAERIAH